METDVLPQFLCAETVYAGLCQTLSVTVSLHAGRSFYQTTVFLLAGRSRGGDSCPALQGFEVSNIIIISISSSI